jgi:HD-like signal output (HDOD) protein
MSTATAPDKRTELLLQQLEQLPTLPTVAVRVLELTSNEKTSARDLVTLIESDPALTARILRVVHRADGGLRADINSVERAVVFLGFEAVRNATLAVGVFETFGPHSAEKASPTGKRFNREDFWKHCLATACCAELIAEQLKSSGKSDPKAHPTGLGAQCASSTSSSSSASPASDSARPSAPLPRDLAIEPSDAFVAGLLHDIGKVAIDAALPKSFARVVEACELLRSNIADVERTVIGLDHMTVGKRLAERWMLPAILRDCIWLHGQLPQALPDTVRNPRLVNIITLADLVVRQQHIGYSGNYQFTVPVPTLLEAIGLSPAQLEAAAQLLVARIEPRAKALGLGASTSEDLYRQALIQANTQLSHMTDQLQTKNRKLAIRAKFFEALSGFHEELRPDAPPSVVLTAIAQTAASVLDCNQVAAFSFNASADLAEQLVVNKAGDVVQRGMVEAPSDRASAESNAATRHIPANLGDGPIYPVTQELEWISQSVAPRLGGSNLYWIALRSDSEIIGGVLWGASADESARLSSQFNELAALTGGWSLALRTC